MKINDVQKQLGITKANIRFYEKEGLITPARSENGYREYSEADINQLKEIIILRKLGIPVQQIADIQNGALPLREALDNNIAALQAEITKLNGSLALCKQLQAEDARMLDTERYWEIIHEKEQQGFRFQTLAQDYINFVDSRIRDGFYIPEDKKKDHKAVIKFILLHCLFWGFLGALTGRFWWRLGFRLYLDLVFPFILGIFLIPAFIIGRKKKSMENRKICDSVHSCHNHSVHWHETNLYISSGGT